MTLLGTAAIAVVALLHAGFMALEMFFWTRPAGMKIFRLTPAFAAASRALAANQGLYNGFLAAGLFWGAAIQYQGDSAQAGVPVFFLGCAIVAGIYGGFTVSRRIVMVQAVPALIALVLTLLSHG